MSNCNNNELIEKAKRELDLLGTDEIKQAYKDVNLTAPIIVGGSECSKREVLLDITRQIIECNEKLAFSIHSTVMQKRNNKNMEKY